MQLHECAHRRLTVDPASGAMQIVCGVAQQILGLDRDTACQVDESVCARCGRLPAPTAAVPNAVVASVVYNVSMRLVEDDRTPDSEFGKAYQAQRYVLASLADGGDARPSKPAPPSKARRNGRPKVADDDGRPSGRDGAATRGALSRLRDRVFARASRQRARVGIVGYNTASGLGYLTRDLATQGVAERWLIVPHPRFPAIDLPATRCRIDLAGDRFPERKLSSWLGGLDWVLFAELNYLEALPRLARKAGIRVALIPMWESMSPFAEWLRLVDLLICPTRHSAAMFLQWKARYGFTWEVRFVAWPVASDRFRYRQRERCERFVFINGTGGVPAHRLDGAVTPVRRKGLDVVLDTARLAPEIPWIVYSQTDDFPEWPENVLVMAPPADNADLYAAGDVCVQPSRWEGLGLQLLECQAAGLPLVTTDAAPMNEHNPLRVIRPQNWEWGYVHDGQPVQLPVFDPSSLVKVIRELRGTDLTAASAAARDFVERHHRWDQAAATLRQIFDAVLVNDASAAEANSGCNEGQASSTVDTCRYRTPAPSEKGAEEMAACELLRQLLLPATGDACGVLRPVCEACCRSFPPTPAAWNPVIASLVYSHTQDTGDQVARRAGALKQRAEQFLEIDSLPLVPDGRALSRRGAPAPGRLRELLPAPRLRCGSLVRQWAVGVTTAPRRQPTLERCLDSLARAGWPRPVLFADGGVRVPERFRGLPAACRDEPLGAWPHYYLSLAELLMREPLADAYLMVQDDALFFDRENVREYLEEALWPGSTPGIISLYCAGSDPRAAFGWANPAGRWRFGAVAFIFPRRVAIDIVLDQPVLAHRWSDDREGLVGIPGVIEDWARRRSASLYFPTPSLVQHIGSTSAIWQGAYELTASRRAGCFAGDVIAAPPTE